MSDRHQTQPYPLRMPAALRMRLEAAAADNRRSLHSEIIARLESTLKSTLGRGLDVLLEKGSKSDDLLESISVMVGELHSALLTGSTVKAGMTKAFEEVAKQSEIPLKGKGPQPSKRRK